MPIVLYTGKQKWNANKYLEDNTFISKMMLIEKSKNTEEIAETLEKIISKTQKEDKELLRRIIEIILEEKIGITKSKELIKKLEKGSDSMLAIVDMIRKENQMYIDMGRKEGKKEGKREGKKVGRIEGKKDTLREIAIKMLKKNLTEKEITEITGISKKELNNLKLTNNYK